MRIIGLLSFFDESATWLAQSVASLARFCDHIIAVDGRYAQYPSERNQSSSEEIDAISGAARAAGLGYTISSSNRVWFSEMEKRTHLFQLGNLHAESFEDWFYVIDADEVIVEAPDAGVIKERLAEYQANGVTGVNVNLWEKIDTHAAGRNSLSQKLPVPYEFQNATPRLWLVHNNMRVEDYHWKYLGDNQDGETVQLWGRESTQHGGLCSMITMEHRNLSRAKVRFESKMEYYKIRDESGIEEQESVNV